MPYKTFLDGSALAAPDIQNYLMNQMIDAEVTTRPPSPALGQVSYVHTNGDFHYCVNAVGPVWSAWKRRFLYNTSTSALSTTTTTFLKDTGCGDLSFSVLFSNDVYQIRYWARANTDTASTVMDFRIYDGGASSPTTSSTQLAGGSIELEVLGGPGASQLFVEWIGTLSAGTHTVAAFYGRTGGGGNVKAEQSSSGARFLTVELMVSGT